MKPETSLQSDHDEVRIGVSACLLGDKVRYDGGHKKNDFLTGMLGNFVTWVPICPEVEVGLGVPRPALRLIEKDGEVRLVEKPPGRGEYGADHTVAMREWARRKLRLIARMNLSGYIFKKDSPSCGMEHVRLYGKDRMPRRIGRGLFADALITAYPNLPVEEEGRLTDPHLRENFIERVFAYHDLRRLFEKRWTIGQLVAFHSRHKLQLLAHSAEAYRRLGRLVAAASRGDRAELAQRYQDEFMAALRLHTTPRRNANVLQHMAGYLKNHLDQVERVELQELIADFRAGLVPLIVPITLLRHYVRKFNIAYLQDQVYLAPHPKELMLRNHV
jgi:uncharacterized protein YbgA (DUF1722 family)/uncharacterized protein YbbK (DUF523 family)